VSVCVASLLDLSLPALFSRVRFRFFLLFLKKRDVSFRKVAKTSVLPTPVPFSFRTSATRGREILERIGSSSAPSNQPVVLRCLVLPSKKEDGHNNAQNRGRGRTQTRNSPWSNPGHHANPSTALSHAHTTHSTQLHTHSLAQHCDSSTLTLSLTHKRRSVASKAGKGRRKRESESE
jgi:hypothetical protein